MDSNKQPEFTKKYYGNQIWELIEPPGRYHQYLIVGDERALLIDTGMGIGKLGEYVSEITDKPLIVINTHGHPDHAGGNAQFETVYLHPADIEMAGRMTALEFRRTDFLKNTKGEHEELLEFMQPTPSCEYLPVSDGQVIELGARELVVYHIPGHSAGSVVIYDEKSCGLFAGDSVMPIINIPPFAGTTVPEMRTALEQLRELKIGRIYCGHAMPESVHEGRDLYENVMKALLEITNRYGAQLPAPEERIAFEYAGVKINCFGSSLRG